MTEVSRKSLVLFTQLKNVILRSGDIAQTASFTRSWNRTGSTTLWSFGTGRIKPNTSSRSRLPTIFRLTLLIWTVSSSWKCSEACYLFVINDFDDIWNKRFDFSGTSSSYFLWLRRMNTVAWRRVPKRTLDRMLLCCAMLSALPWTPSSSIWVKLLFSQLYLLLAASVIAH